MKKLKKIELTVLSQRKQTKNRLFREQRFYWLVCTVTCFPELLERFELQGKTGFGMPRNTATPVNFADGGKKWTIEELRATDSIVRLQSGTNRFESQVPNHVM